MFGKKPIKEEGKGEELQGFLQSRGFGLGLRKTTRQKKTRRKKNQRRIKVIDSERK